jgi:hypothetical protein
LLIFFKGPKKLELKKLNIKKSFNYFFFQKYVH